MKFTHHYAVIGLRAIALVMESENKPEAAAVRRLAAEIADQPDRRFCFVDAARMDETTSPAVAKAAAKLMKSADPAVRRVAASALTQKKRKGG